MSSSSSSSTPILFRECGKAETFFVKGFENGSFKLVNSVVIRVAPEIDLFANQCHLLKTAVLRLKAQHALLRCKILKLDDERYGFYENEDTKNSINNLECVYYKGSGTHQEQQLRKLLVHKELNGLMDPTKDDLWRFLFYKLSGEENEYYVILSIHHAITDGRNAYYVFLQLFSIIEDLVYGEDHSEKQVQLFPSVEEVFRDIYAKIDQSETEISKRVTSVTSRNDFTPKEADHPTFTVTDGAFHDQCTDNEVITIQKIIEMSLNSPAHNRTHLFASEHFDKFVEKCKAHKVKVTACLNTILAIAVARYYEFKKVEKRSDEMLKSMVAISMRQFEGFKAELEDNVNYNVPIGFYVAYFCVLFESTINAENFWEKVCEANETFQSRMATQDHLKSIFQSALSRPVTDEAEIKCHFGVSNYGELPMSTSKRGAIRICEHFMTQTMSKERLHYMFFMYVQTIETRGLCISMNAAAKFIPSEMLDFVSKHFIELFHSLI